MEVQKEVRKDEYVMEVEDQIPTPSPKFVYEVVDTLQDIAIYSLLTLLNLIDNVIEKYGDPGPCLVDCKVGEEDLKGYMCDSGACISIMPLKQSLLFVSFWSLLRRVVRGTKRYAHIIRLICPQAEMGKESSGNMEQWLNKMVSEPYYLFHFLSFFSYLVVRSSAVQVLAPQLTLNLLRREILTGLVFAVLVALKAAKEETWEAFIADILFLAKICLFALAFTLDRRIALWYILVFLVIHILTQQPPSEGLGACTKLTPLQLEGLLTEGNTSRLWLVEFCASYSSSCIRSSRHFPELSITYSNKNLSFGIVDLGLFPSAAEKFGISLGGFMGQLPTYILFENAAEVARFPELDFEATFFNPTITMGFLSRHFELDWHLLDYVNGK
ncbi:hypothetical protein PIB30_054102 [Stylosanthes scabra]|uniref:Thioredoxin-related transmembrane protein 2 n=1 Tax=Stylosanthes scabra TaxID=79078 RepID=A0ABU6RIR2_9FABA|nr:hypothetical protein [Stylosanthes scabra]